MAGNPFLRAVLQKIRTTGGWAPVLERVASGESLTKIAATYGCSRHSIYKLLHKNDKLWDLFCEARRESAFALAEEGKDILEDLAAEGKMPTREDIALARERVQQRRWLAAAYDRDTFGIQSPTGEGGVLNIGALHLRVLMAPPTQHAVPATARPTVGALMNPDSPRVVDAEIIEVTNETNEARGQSEPTQSEDREGGDRDATRATAARAETAEPAEEAV